MYSVGSTTRPNRATDKHDEGYDFKWAQYVLYRGNSPEIAYFRMKNTINNFFYHGDSNNKWQWILQDDLDTFLNDESGSPRFRVNWTENIIMPIVRQYIGNAIRTDFNYTVKPMSEAVKLRRDKELSRMKGMTRLANDLGPGLGDTLKQTFAIGNSEAETEQLFNGYYSDDLIRGINDLMKITAERNDLQGELKNWLAEQLAVNGIAVLHDIEHSGYQSFERIDANTFIWDPSARQADLQDGIFMGDYWFDDPVNIFERYPGLSYDERETIENVAKTYNFSSFWYNNAYLGNMTGKVRVIRSYWKDIAEFEYGVIVDEFGNQMFMRVNHEDSPYTDDDLIDYKAIENPVLLKRMNGKKKIKDIREVIRRCLFVDNTYQLGSGKYESLPIILESGEMPNPENNVYSHGRVQFPYKCGTFKYYVGIPQSPVDLMIDPQRIVNRVNSVREQQINRMQPPVLMYDKTIIDAQIGEEETLRRLQNGEPVSVNGRQNLPNNIYQKPGTDLSGMSILNEVSAYTKTSAQSATGVNENMLGTGAMELVRNTQAMINQGSLMQEDFFSTIGNIIKQCYQSMATRGRKIYYDNPTNLSYSISGDDARAILVSPESLNESVMITVSKAKPYMSDVEAANALAFQMLQAGLLDQSTYALIIDRSTTQDVYAAVSKYLYKKAITDEKMAAQQQADIQAQQAREDAIRMEGINMQRETTAQASENSRMATQAKLDTNDAMRYDTELRSQTELAKAAMKSNQSKE